MKPKYAVKGLPDFHNMQDSEVKALQRDVQQLVFSYKQYDSGKVKVLEEIWKDLANETTRRLVTSKDCFPISYDSPGVMKRKKLSRSPISLKRGVDK